MSSENFQIPLYMSDVLDRLDDISAALNTPGQSSVATELLMLGRNVEDLRVSLVKSLDSMEYTIMQHTAALMIDRGIDPESKRYKETLTKLKYL